MSHNTEKIEHLLSHNAESVIDKKHLESALIAGKKLRVKLGIDPTSSDLHIGHAVVLEKLKEFQDLGCLPVLVIGDFTAQIGDPSGRDKTRPPLTEKEVKANMKNYLKQAAKVFNVKKAKIAYNSEWLRKLNGSALIQLLEKVSVQQIIEREDFSKRLAAQNSIRMHELLYPVMQAYDSVAIKADLELGGTDQLFNLLMGRTLMEKMGLPAQDIFTVSILEGLDGKKKMSKSLGNYIGLADAAEDMFGKVMSIPDEIVQKYFAVTADVSSDEFARMKRDLKPKELKERLGLEIVKRYHGEAAAQNACEHFESVFSKGEAPSDVPDLAIKQGDTALEIVVRSGVPKSKSEARRLIEQGGFDINGTVEKEPMAKLELHGGEILRIGKRRFFRAK